MNGYIQAKHENTPTYNEFGEDISEESAFDAELIPCKYYTPNTQNGELNFLVEKAGGIVTQASYIITTKNMTISGKHFALYDSKQTLICKKDCKSLQRLENIRRTKIVL